MAVESESLSPREKRLDEIIAAYVQAAEAGQAPDRQELLARHLDLAAELAEFFADQEQFERLAAPIKAMTLSARKAIRTGPAEPAPIEPSTRIGYFGDYEILGEIARGGMGVVYKARQRSLQRLVALKMIRFVHLAGPTSVQRFHVEAQAAANLDHPHIVPIYEVGEWQGQPYFSMKLIEGGNLTQQASRLLKEPRTVARLLATVARTVHYAHQRGLLHRDLKPANILLDAEQRPHVTDFGLAKYVQEDAGLTESGAVVGTPSYMAPEQAAGRTRELTTAADVYSLGAILYELLTGRPPFRAETPLETLRQVVEQEPLQPRKLNPHANRDLETICLKCLDKDPRRRYLSAEELADDLQRFLEDEPIRARRRTFVLRTRKWVRRHHRATVALVLLVLFLLLAWTWSMVQLARARQLALAERAQVEYRFEQARQAVDQLFTQTNEQLRDAGGRSDPLRSRLLDEALAFYQSLVQREGGSGGRPEVVQAYRRMGKIHESRGQKQEAERAYLQALASAGKMGASQSADARVRAELARCHSNLASLYKSTDRQALAEREYREALATWDKLATESPTVQEYVRERDMARKALSPGEGQPKDRKQPEKKRP
jgi:tetratricopeptide (TPR) repeat protein